ncbi:MAG: porin family protein [Bacteroidales bacterium]|nr:porin family protein [Bacteroidales bacterium]
MKKVKTILSLAVLFFIYTAVNAQVDKGKFLFGASSNMNALFGSSKVETTQSGTTTKTDGPKTVNFNITPTFGYFIIDGLAAGLFFDIDMDNCKYEQELQTGDNVDLIDNISTMMVGPFIRYYINLGKIKPFVEGSIGFGSMKNKYEYLDWTSGTSYTIKEEEDKYSIFNWGLGAGVAFFLSDNVALDLMLGYNSMNTNYKDDDNDFEYKNMMSSFGLNVGFTIVIP